MNRFDSLSSIRWFGYYTLAVGGVLLLSPAWLLPSVFGPMATASDGSRLLGFVLLCSGYYYVRAAQIGFVAFARWTVHTRLAAGIVVTVLVATRQAAPGFLLMGAIDSAAGLVTAWLLRRERPAAAATNNTPPVSSVNR